MTDQNEDPGIVASASGYTINTRPGPALYIQKNNNNKALEALRNYSK